MTDEPFWETEEYLDYNERQDALVDELQEDLIRKGASILLAVSLGLDEAEVEVHIDGLWDPLRARALDPETVDEVIGLLVRYVNGDAQDRVGDTLDFLDLEGL